MAKYIMFICFLLISCSEKSVSFTGKTMGTTYMVKAFGKDLNSKGLQTEIDKLLKAYNYRFSTYIENSELSLVNKAPINKKLQISDELMRLIKESSKIYNKTDGYYDVTVGPLVNRWGFGPVAEKGKPSPNDVKRLLRLTGMNHLNIHNDGIIKLKNIYIDLSSIAKGDAVDKVANLLKKKFKLKNYFVEIGGEVRVSGIKPDNVNWKVGIEKPNLIQGSGIQKILSLQDESIATSGSYRNYKKYGDSVFSHVIDPKTGYPVKHQTISVSVVTESCAIADAWATAFMSMGVKKSLDIAKKEGLKVFFLVKEEGKIKEYKTKNFGN